LTPLDYEVLRVIGYLPSRIDDQPIADAEIEAVRRLAKEGRCVRSGLEVALTPAGREALRIHEALLAAGIAL
jgi:hypothetical protein